MLAATIWNNNLTSIVVYKFATTLSRHSIFPQLARGKIAGSCGYLLLNYFSYSDACSRQTFGRRYFSSGDCFSAKSPSINYL